MQFLSDAHQIEKGKRYLSIFILIIFSFSLNAKAQLNGETLLQEEVLLTCTFGETIDEKRQPFRILDDQSENVLKCSWEKGKLFCSVGDGYSFDWRISDKVTVRKPRGLKPTICFCFLVDQDNTQYERPCTVEGPVQQPAGKEIQTQNSGLDKDFSPLKSQSQDFSENGSHSKSDDSFLITIIALTVVLSVLFVAVIVFFIKWRRDRHRQENDRKTVDPFINKAPGFLYANI